MFETGDDFDDKKNRVQHAHAFRTGDSSYYVLHKGGRDPYKLHIVDRRSLVGVQDPEGTLYVFDGWSDQIKPKHSTGRVACWNRKEITRRQVPGRPVAVMTVEDIPQFSTPTNPNRDPKSGIVKLKDEQIIVKVSDSFAPKIFSSLSGVDVVYDVTEYAEMRAEMANDNCIDGSNRKSTGASETCSSCQSGTIGWNKNKRLGECSSCGEYYKYKQGEWIPQK